MAEYIEREVAIQSIEEVVMAMESWVTDYQAQRHGLMTAITTVMDVPAANVVPVRHGRWGKKNDCSLCGCQPWFERDIHFLHYCPNCGARMDSKEREKKIRKTYIDVGSCRGWIIEGGLDKDGDGDV